MTAKNVDTFLKNMQNKAKKQVALGKEVLYTATFITGRSQRKLLERMNAKSLVKQVKAFIEVEKPEKIKIDLFTNTGDYIDMNVCELTDNQPTPQPVEQFKGFGEAEISQIVDQRLSEKQRIIEFEQMKEEVKELTSENEDLQNQIDKLEERNQELETELENKKQIKYYTGMLGDILESLGFSKEKMRKPFVELMGLKDEKEAEKKELSAKTTDNSGIVEETKEPVKSPNAAANTTEEQKRAEVINLIAEYLKSTTNEVLAKIFTIFSDIEANNAVADDLLEFLQKRKEFAQ